MDVIDDVVATARAGRAVARRNRYAGAWGVRFPAIRGVGLHVVRRGAPWLIPDGDSPIPLGVGSVVFVPHGRRHGFSDLPVAFGELPGGPSEAPDPDSFDVDFVSCCYHLDRGHGHNLLSGLPDIIALTVDDDRSSALPMLADLLGEHAAGSRPGNAVALPAVVDLMLVHLLRLWHDQRGRGDWPATPDPRIAHVLRVLQEAGSTSWTVQQLSALAGLSRAAFSRRFTAVTGVAPGAYLTGLRLGHGAELLRSTQLTLADIAQQTGYSTEFSFSAAFRREYGVSPGRFRHRETRETSPPAGEEDVVR